LRSAAVAVQAKHAASAAASAMRRRNTQRP
jgi:hypothetical protein